MQLLLSYPLMPGQCAGCSNADGRRVLDTGVNVEFYGQVYFCEECCKHIGRIFGLKDDASAPVAEVNTEEIGNYVQAITASISGLQSVLGEFSSLLDMDPVSKVTVTEPNEGDRTSEPGQRNSEPARSDSNATEIPDPVHNSDDKSAGDKGSNGVSVGYGNDAGDIFKL